MDIKYVNSNHFEERKHCGQKQMQATTLLEGGFPGSAFLVCISKEKLDSGSDLDVDGDDTEV